MKSPIYIWLLCCAAVMSAQDLDVITDLVQFRTSTNQTQLELHYSFADTTLRYMLAPNGFSADMLCSLEVRKDTSLVAGDVWIAHAESNVASPRHSRYYAGVRRVFVDPGMYTVVFSASDVNNEKRTITQTSKLTVRTKQNAPEMSDVMFVMPKSESLASQFVRAGQSCEPNPRHEVTGVQPVLGMYMEFYNIKQSQVKSSYAEIAIFNHVLEEELTTYRQIMPTSDLLALRDEIQLENLKTGVYSLRVRLLSEDKSAVYDSREERFYLINPEQLPEQQRLITEDEDFQASQWSVLAGDRLKLELDLSQVLATKTEIETLKLCSDERSKQRYLYRFWKQRDPDDATPANERLDQFRKMYDKAQSMYSSITYKEGWRSDRGTVLLRYGQPTRIKQYFRTDEARPYEKWWYQNIQGGACFYFVDVNEQQDHRLVHSTMNGWVFQPDWYRLFASYKTVTGSDIRSVREILPDNSTAGIGGSRQRLGGIQEDPNDQFPDCENVTSR